VAYRCWGDDREDLTVLVESALSDYEPVFGLMPRRRRPPAEQIIVTCTHGHQNVFDVPPGYEKKQDD
jgi:hypothetical protein